MYSFQRFVEVLPDKMDYKPGSMEKLTLLTDKIGLSW